MIKKKLVLFIGVLIAVACFLVWQKTRPDDSPEPSSSASPILQTQADHETSAGPPKSSEEISATRVASDRSGNTDVRVSELRKQVLISGEDLNDVKKVLLQQESVGLLCRTKSREAVSLLAEALFDSKQRYFTKAKDSAGKVYTNSHMFMDALAGCLEGVPEPLRIIYSDEDLPRLKSWWLSNNSKLQFKPAAAQKLRSSDSEFGSHRQVR